MATASASLFKSFFSGAEGLDLPDDGDGEAWPDVLDAFSVFSMAFVAAAFAPSSADASGFDAGAEGVETSRERIFGALGAASSLPIESVLTGGGSVGVGFDGIGAVEEVEASLPVGLFAMIGVP